MRIDRLNQLIDRLKNTSDDSFNMSSWLEPNMVYVYEHINADNDLYMLRTISGNDLIAHPERFKNAISQHTCGTVGCIAGHILVITSLDDTLTRQDDGDVISYAGSWLGISYDSAKQLFVPPSLLVNYDLVTRQRAIAVLENLRDTGYVDWFKAAPEVVRGHGTSLSVYRQALSVITTYLAGPSEFVR